MKKDNNYYSELAERAVYDSEAFEELYNHFFRIVYNLVYVQVKNSDTADDITSEIFLKVSRNLDKFDSSIASFATWISRITRRTCIDYFRSHGRKQDNETEWDEEFNPAAPEFEQPENQFLLNENKKILLKAVETLSKREQKIIELKFWADMSNKEIGETLNISAGNVGIILFRAMSTLRKKLEKKL